MGLVLRRLPFRTASLLRRIGGLVRPFAPKTHSKLVMGRDEDIWHGWPVLPVNYEVFTPPQSGRLLYLAEVLLLGVVRIPLLLHHGLLLQGLLSVRLLAAQVISNISIGRHCQMVLRWRPMLAPRKECAGVRRWCWVRDKVDLVVASWRSSSCKSGHSTASKHHVGMDTVRRLIFGVVRLANRRLVGVAREHCGQLVRLLALWCVLLLVLHQL